MRETGQLLVLLGAALLAVGAALLLLARLPGTGRVPGDLVFRHGGWTVFVPLGTMIVASIVLTVLLNLFWRK